MAERLSRPIAEQFEQGMKSNPVLITLFKMLFNQENRLRALEGGQPISKVEFRAALKTQFVMKG